MAHRHSALSPSRGREKRRQSNGRLLRGPCQALDTHSALSLQGQQQAQPSSNAWGPSCTMVALASFMVFLRIDEISSPARHALALQLGRLTPWKPETNKAGRTCPSGSAAQLQPRSPRKAAPAARAACWTSTHCMPSIWGHATCGWCKGWFPVSLSVLCGSAWGWDGWVG
jgi:hypothetical protein